MYNSQYNSFAHRFSFCVCLLAHFPILLLGINTRIGQANYQSFFPNHGIDLSMELAHFIIQIALIIVMFIGDPTKDRADDWFHAGTNEFVNAVLIVFLVFNFVAIFLIGQLLWFHSGLQRENLTTYKYIVRDHQRKRDKMRLEGEIMQLRHTEMAKARQQGKCLQSLAWRWEINVDKLAAFLVIP
jgi:hypothetical protein